MQIFTIAVQDISVYILLIAGVIFSIGSNKLTVLGAITGGIIGLYIYKGAGFTGIAMLILFFLLSSFATKWLLAKKQSMGIAEREGGKRSAGQVLANGGVAAILGAVALYHSQYAFLLKLMTAGSLASATADTLSSELGSLYGRKFYDVLSFKKSTPGPDGVISLEGTLIGAGGATIIALIYSIGAGFSYHIFLIIVAGVIGNLADSILGATLERRHLINNNTVNFINTAIGALVCWLCYVIIK